MAINNLYISHAKYNFDSRLSKLLDCKNCQKSMFVWLLKIVLAQRTDNHKKRRHSDVESSQILVT
jgi:hypothetical protein